MQQHVLIAEDEPLLLKTMSMVLKAAKFTVSTASNGKDAMELLKSGIQIDILVTDIQMPGMNGEELIDEIKKIRPDMPILVVTGFGGKDLLLRLLRRGCDDYLDKPFTSVTLEKTVRALAEKNLSVRQDRQSYTDNLEDRQGLLNRELAVLQERYNSLRTQVESAVSAHRGFSAFSRNDLRVNTVLYNQPYAQLGGDWATAYNTENGVDVIVADVSGHDMGASFHTVALKTFFEEHRSADRDGAYLFELLNRLLLISSGQERIITAAFLRINLEIMQAQIISAAHIPVTSLPSGESLPRPLYVSGAVLGMFESVSFETRRFPIKQGDRFFLYTDGLANCTRIDGPTGTRTRLSPIGIDNLIMAHREKNINEMTDNVWSGAMEFCRNRLDDDALLLGVQIPEGL